MGRMKNFLHEVSDNLGYDGRINQEVLNKANELLHDENKRTEETKKYQYVAKTFGAETAELI